MKREQRERCLTVMDVVRTVQDAASSDEEVVAVITHLFRSGRLLLAKDVGSRRIESALAS